MYSQILIVYLDGSKRSIRMLKNVSNVNHKPKLEYYTTRHSNGHLFFQ